MHAKLTILISECRTAVISYASQLEAHGLRIEPEKALKPSQTFRVSFARGGKVEDNDLRADRSMDFLSFCAQASFAVHGYLETVALLATSERAARIFMDRQ